MANIPRAEVPAWMRLAADGAAIEAAQALGLPPVNIRWHRSDPGNSIGWVDADDLSAIHLSADRMATAYDVKAMVFHECRHIWQWRSGRFYGDKGKMERDAQDWSYRQTGYLVDYLVPEWEY